MGEGPFGVSEPGPVRISWSPWETIMTPTMERMTLIILLEVKRSTPAQAPIPSVKNPDMEERIVVLLTLV